MQWCTYQRYWLTDFLKIFILLYADDTVLFAENATDMQKSLLAFQEYCVRWKLTVNTTKTKVVIFGSKGRRSPVFKLFDNNLDIIANGYKYLGVHFSRTCTFSLNMKGIKEQATKAMFLLKSRIRNLDLPIDCQLKLFDQTILPILLYGSEVWGFENCSVIESIHLKFLRSILNVKSSTPLYMIYGELGRYPLSIHVKYRMVKFWFKILNGKNSKLSFIMYNALLNDHVNGSREHKWITCVKNIFNETGFSFVWLSQNADNYTDLSQVILKTLEDQYLQCWRDTVYHSGKSACYRIFKDNINLEPYLTILNKNLRSFLYVTELQTIDFLLKLVDGIIPL